MRRLPAHETAARVQVRLRRAIYDQIVAIGPGTVQGQRSGALSLSLVEGVEQLEVYFGQFLPQFLISLLTPILIFAAIAFIDLPVAAVMLAFAVIALIVRGRDAVRVARDATPQIRINLILFAIDVAIVTPAEGPSLRMNSGK